MSRTILWSSLGFLAMMMLLANQATDPALIERLRAQVAPHDYAQGVRGDIHSGAQPYGTIPPATFTLTTSTRGTGSGTITLEPPGGVYESGTKVMLSAMANQGASFGQWSGACQGTDPVCLLTMNSAKAVTATFSAGPVARHRLTTQIAGNGFGTISLDPPGGAYASGTVVTATAMGMDGSSFVGWSGACSGSQLCRIHLQQSAAVTATFVLMEEGVNNKPVAQADEVSTSKGRPVTIDLVANDYDVDDDRLEVHGINQPSDDSGALAGSMLLNGAVAIFTPLSGFTGIATVDYLLSDGRGGFDTATVTVTVLEESLLLRVPSQERLSHNFESTLSVAFNGISQPSTDPSQLLQGVNVQTFLDIPPGAIPPDGEVLAHQISFGWLQPAHFTQQQRDSFPTPIVGGLLPFVIEAIVDDVTRQEYGFGTPIKIAFNYDDQLWDQVAEANLSALYWSSRNQQWQSDGVHIIQHDLGSNLVVLEINHLTQFALFAQPQTSEPSDSTNETPRSLAPELFFPLIQ